jgi:hypothetical protein
MGIAVRAVLSDKYVSPQLLPQQGLPRGHLRLQVLAVNLCFLYVARTAQ